MNENHAVKLFEDKKIRSLWIDEEQQWYFSVIDVVQVLTDSVNPRNYCANVKSLFRIIQSIPSPKAEQFKQWLSRVGYERILEIENPELAQD